MCHDFVVLLGNRISYLYFIIKGPAKGLFSMIGTSLLSAKVFHFFRYMVLPFGEHSREHSSALSHSIATAKWVGFVITTSASGTRCSMSWRVFPASVP